MLTNKGYYIPKYLYKRKIYLLKEKVIKRKYGYLFFRKAVSKILPSQATLHYERNLKKKAVKVWIMFWYEERIEWKLIIKANIHYRLGLLQKILHKWKLYRISIRFEKLKKEIAIVHSLKNSRRQVISWAFNKWKIFIGYKRRKATNIRIAKEFFWSKYNPEFLRVFFKRWKILKTVSLRKKKIMQKTIKHYERYLIKVSFEKIKIYKTKRIFKHEFEKKYIVMYEKKMLSKIFVCWKKFVVMNRHKRENNLLAMQHYIFTSKQNCLLMFRKYTTMSITRKFKLNGFRQSHNKRLIAKYFDKLKRFKENGILKRKKIALADNLFHRNQIRKMFNKLKEYSHYCKNKQIRLAETIAKIKVELTFKKKKFLYEKWKTYYLQKLSKKHKYATAKVFAERQVLQNYLNAWKNFLFQKNAEKSQIIRSCVFHNLKITKKYFETWKYHTGEMLLFQNHLTKALDLYKRHLVEEGLLLIIRSGFLQKDKNFEKSTQIFIRHLFLSYKYFSLWRRKTLKLSLVKKCTPTTPMLVDDLPCSIESFEWYPICFLAPRTFQNKN